MSTSYLIVTEPKTDWYIEPEALTNALKKRWPQVNIEWIDNPKREYFLEWTIVHKDGSTKHGLLAKGFQSIVLRRMGLEESAEFAIWFQEQHPETDNLVYLDEEGSFVVRLKGHTVEEIVHLAHSFFSIFDKDGEEA